MVFGRIVELCLGKESSWIKLTKLKISFEVKFEKNNPAFADIDIFNVNKETQSRYFKEGVSVRLTAGYRYGLGSGVIFDGEILKVDRVVESPDVKFTLFCGSHRALFKELTNLSMRNAITSQILTIIGAKTGCRIEKENLPHKVYESFNEQDTALSILKKIAFDLNREIVFKDQGRITFRENNTVSPNKFKITDFLLQSGIDKTQDMDLESLSFDTWLNYQFTLQSTYLLDTHSHKGETEATELTFLGDNLDGEFKASLVTTAKGKVEKKKGYIEIIRGV